MARLSVNGLQELLDQFTIINALPESVAKDMLNAGADVVVKAQREEIARQWTGPYSIGISAKSVKKGRVKWALDGGHIIFVSPQGTRKRGKSKVSNAEIAFLNEYGVSGAGRGRGHKRRTATKRTLPRPAMRAANEKSVEKVLAVESRVYHNFLDSINL